MSPQISVAVDRIPISDSWNLLQFEELDLGQNITSLKSAVARAVDGGVITEGEVENIRWEAKGELDKLARHVWIELMQFCFDDDIRESDPEYDAGKRRKLKWYLDELVQLEDKQLS